MINELTHRQAEILSFIRACIAMNGIPPTRAEISHHFGFGSDNAAEQHLRALARHGKIEIIPALSRGIRVLGPASNDETQARDLETLRARITIQTLTALDQCCGHCEYEEAEGQLIRHCDKCCRKIVAALGLLRRKLSQKVTRSSDIGRKPIKHNPSYSSTHKGGVVV